MGEERKNCPIKREKTIVPQIFTMPFVAHFEISADLVSIWTTSLQRIFTMTMMKLVVLLSLPIATLASLRGPSDVKNLFREWTNEFGKEYKTAEEFAERLEIWTENHCKYAD
jgi:hypothetical protein